MPEPTMRYREVAPPAELGRLVACFWEFNAGPGTQPGHIHTIPTDGCTSVSCLVGRGPVTVLGPRLESFRLSIYPETSFIGVRFQPGATVGALGVTGLRLRDFVGLLEAVVSGLAPSVLAAVPAGATLDTAAPGLASAVAEWSSRLGPLDEQATAGAAAITTSRGTAKVASIADAVGLSERQFQRRFREQVGLTPKQFARIVRFRAAAVDVAMQTAGPWGEVAAEHGFADQAHLAREFAQIFGMTPSEFQKTFAPAIEHVDLR